MQRQLSASRTFFDLGLGYCEENLPFVTLHATLGGATKKRATYNRLVVKLLRGEKLTDEEESVAKGVLSGDIFIRESSHHCKLCSNLFEREELVRTSSLFPNWDICVPTHPYYPGGMMVCLKNRADRALEEFQQLEDFEILELRSIADYLLERMQSCNGFNVVGVNILFQQISRSQACIHGHVEPMIGDPHKMNIGFDVKEEQLYDKLALSVNETAIWPGLSSAVSVPQGLRMAYAGKEQVGEMKLAVSKYQHRMEDLISSARHIQDKIRSGVLDLEEIEEERCPGLSGANTSLLIRQLSPAPVLYIYLTMYRGRFTLSLVPELVLDPIALHDISMDEADIYSLKVNNSAIEDKYVLLRQRHPLVRPSMKLSYANIDELNLKYVTSELLNNIERR